MTLYPDILAARNLPPSALAEAARASIAHLPVQWTPVDATDPATVLAVIGAMALSVGLRRPLAWDGLALRGSIDPVAMISGCALREGAVKEQPRLHFFCDSDLVLSVSDLVLSVAPPLAAKLWAGHVSTDRIWTSCQTALCMMLHYAADRADRVGPDEEPPCKIGVDSALEPSLIDGIARWAAQQNPPQAWRQSLWSPSVTGYDASVVGDASRDGYSAAKARVLIVGAAPARELLGLIGACVVEQAGRWPTQARPQIPAIAGIPLRDRLDLDRLMLAGSDLPCEMRLSGQRGYLVA